MIKEHLRSLCHQPISCFLMDGSGGSVEASDPGIHAGSVAVRDRFNKQVKMCFYSKQSFISLQIRGLDPDCSVYTGSSGCQTTQRLRRLHRTFSPEPETRRVGPAEPPHHSSFLFVQLHAAAMEFIITLYVLHSAAASFILLSLCIQSSFSLELITATVLLSTTSASV